MNSIEEFMSLLREEIGLPVTPAHASVGFDEVPDWDSVFLLRVLTAIEQSTGRRLSMPDVLEAGTLGDIYELAVRS
jgi:acyl carrier protein